MFTLNPFVWLADRIVDLFRSLLDVLSQILLNPPRPGNEGGWQEQLFGNVWGAANQISMLVLLCLTMVLIIRRSGAGRALYAFCIALMVAVAGNLWYVGTGALLGFGDSLVKAADFYTPSGGGSDTLVTMPAIVDAFAVIASFAPVLLFSFLLTLELLTFELIILFVRIFGLWFLVFSVFGRAGRSMWRWTINLIVVTIVFGRALARLFLELGHVAIDNLPLGNTAFGAGFYSVTSIALAFAAPIILIIVSNVVYTQIAGGRSASTVDGNVDANTTSDDRLRAEIDNINGAHVATLNISGRSTAGDQPSPDASSDQGRSKTAIQAGVDFLAARAVTATPQGAAAVAAAHTLAATRQPSARNGQASE